MVRFVAIILTSLMFVSFTSDSQQENPLFEGRWILEKIHLKEGTELVTTKRAYLKLEQENSRVGGNGSCNRFGGSFKLNEDSLSFSQLFSTKMYCADVQQTEDKFLSALQKVNRFTIHENQLSLLMDSTLLLEFTNQKE